MRLQTARVALLVLVTSVSASAQQARRVVAVCLGVPEGDRKIRAEIARVVDDALVQKKIARADPVALADALKGFDERCPESDEQRVELAKTAGATDLLVMRVSPDPVIVSGALVAVDGRKYAELRPQKPAKAGKRAKEIESAVKAFVDQLPVGDDLLVPLVDGHGGEQHTTTQPPVEPPKDGQPPATATPTPPTPAQPASSTGWSKWMPWALAGTGVALAGAGGGSFLAASNAAKQFGQYGPPHTPQEAETMRKLQGEELAWRTTGAVLLGVGLATAAGGATWILLSQRADGVSVSVLPLPGGAVVSASF
jgi:hypothetical protein